MAQPQKSTRLLRLGEVTRLTGLGRSTLYARVAVGKFPSPVKIGPRASAWPEVEIDGWIAARIAERDGMRDA